MKRSTQRILTTHTGALPGPSEFNELDARVRSGQPYEQKAYAELAQKSIAEVAKRQAEIGIDIISDGQLGMVKSLLDYSERFAGTELKTLGPEEVAITILKSREREEFRDFYATLPFVVPPKTRTVVTGPLQHKGLGNLERELETFKAALKEVTVEEAFVPVLAPGWIDHFIFNQYYPTEEAFIYAIADVLKPEYRAVVDAGFLLQIDDPGLPDSWPSFIPALSVEEYRKYATLRVEALNYALADIPEDRVRYHICWGSWHGPHTTDLPLREIVDLLLSVRAQAYSIEAANPRHEHEWKVWREVKLPDGKILIPGVVSHATNVVEHPEVVADRIIRYTSVVGRQNVIAGTDCGMGGRCHPQIGWAKLRALVEGAHLATETAQP
jgi:5-methyltetrahydropteroyltriglutamate--homocysteine methyltransferase